MPSNISSNAQASGSGRNPYQGGTANPGSNLSGNSNLSGTAKHPYGTRVGTPAVPLRIAPSHLLTDQINSNELAYKVLLVSSSFGPSFICDFDPFLFREVDKFSFKTYTLFDTDEEHRIDKNNIRIEYAPNKIFISEYKIFIDAKKTNSTQTDVDFLLEYRTTSNNTNNSYKDRCFKDELKIFMNVFTDLYKKHTFKKCDSCVFNSMRKLLNNCPNFFAEEIDATLLDQVD